MSSTSTSRPSASLTLNAVLEQTLRTAILFSAKSCDVSLVVLRKIFNVVVEHK